MRTSFLLLVSLAAGLIPAFAQEPVIVAGGSSPEVVVVNAPLIQPVPLVPVPVTLLVPPEAVPALMVPALYAVPLVYPSFPVQAEFCSSPTVIYFGGPHSGCYSSYSTFNCQPRCHPSVIYFGGREARLRGYAFGHMR